MAEDEKFITKTVTLSNEIVDWIDTQIEKKRFRNLSHALDFCVWRLMELEKENVKDK